MYIKRSFSSKNRVSCEELPNISRLHDDIGKFQPANRCTPVIEIFPDDLDETYVFIVMPFMPEANLELLETVQDVMELVGQVLLVCHW